MTPGGESPEAESPDAFRARVRAWFDTHAPAKGGPDDFSAAHIVSGRTPEEYEERERRAVERTRAWQRTLFEAGFANPSWPVELGGRAAPPWHDEIVASVQTDYGVSNKMFAVGLEMLPAVLFSHGTSSVGDGFRGP